MLVLSCLAALCFCILFWGSLAMLFTAKITLFLTGVLLIIGLAVLTWIIACICWLIEEAEYRSRTLTYIADAESKNDLSWKATLEKELAERKWYDSPVMASLILLHIVLYGIVSPYWLIYGIFEWIHERINNLFSRKRT